MLPLLLTERTNSPLPPPDPQQMAETVPSADGDGKSRGSRCAVCSLSREVWAQYRPDCNYPSTLNNSTIISRSIRATDSKDNVWRKSNDGKRTIQVGRVPEI